MENYHITMSIHWTFITHLFLFIFVIPLVKVTFRWRWLCCWDFPVFSVFLFCRFTKGRVGVKICSIVINLPPSIAEAAAAETITTSTNESNHNKTEKFIFRYKSLAQDSVLMFEIYTQIVDVWAKVGWSGNEPQKHNKYSLQESCRERERERASILMWRTWSKRKIKGNQLWATERTQIVVCETGFPRLSYFSKR